MMSRYVKVVAESIDAARPTIVRRQRQHHPAGHYPRPARPTRRQPDNGGPVNRVAAGHAKSVTPGRRVYLGLHAAASWSPSGGTARLGTRNAQHLREAIGAAHDGRARAR
jgi:hypothetical protein